MTTDWGFDLQLEETEEGFRATVLHSPAGAATRSFALPFGRREQHTIMQRLLADPGDDESQRAEQFMIARDAGGRLFDAIFRDEILECWRTSWREAYTHQQTLRVRLRLYAAGLLRALPWEYLYDSSREEFVALSVHTPLVRYQERAHQILPYKVTLPLRVLVVLAGPEGYPPLPIGVEWRDLVDTVDYLAADRRIIFERLSKPTLLDLQRRLREGEYHMVHIVGFSVHDPQTNDGVLIMEDEMGRGRAVSGQHLGTLLSDHYSMRLMLVSSRNAARVPGIDPAAEVVAQSVRHGLPAAVFQPSALLNRPSLAFTHEFYAALAGFGSVDVAMAHARRAIQLEEAGAGWGMPQLATRVADGRLFELREPSTGEPPKRRLNLRSVFSPPSKP